MDLNSSLQSAINSLAGHIHILDEVMKAASKYLIYMFPLLLLVLWFWPAKTALRAENQRIAASAALAVFLALAMVALANRIHFQPRPFEVRESTKLLIAHGPGNGFPSEHLAVSFAVATAIAWRRKFGLLLLGGGVLIGFARIYVGVHWPLDILVGALIGGLAGILMAWASPLMLPVQRRICKFFPAIFVARPST